MSHTCCTRTPAQAYRCDCNSLGMNNIGPAGCVSFAAALKANTSLTTLQYAPSLPAARTCRRGGAIPGLMSRTA